VKSRTISEDSLRFHNYDDLAVVKEVVKRQHLEFVEFFNEELRFFGESIGALYGLVNAEEDYTCYETKRRSGKRDKRWGS
jgi:hypothetical protein